jgi:membrane protein implicated in regulation of membrane protease activity
MTALEPGRESRPPGDRLDHAVVVALGLAAAALAVAGLTSQRLGVPVALWVAAGGAVPLSLGMLLIAHERARRVRETERIKRRETAAVLAEKLAEARRRSESIDGAQPIIGDDVSQVPYPTDLPPEPVLEVVADPDPESVSQLAEMPEDPAPECASIERVAQLEETVVNLNRQVEELAEVIRGAARGVRASRAGRHSGPPEENELAQLTEESA